MTEDVARWWARRQWSKALEVPYAVGAYRSDWQRYPALVRQFHPELNAGVVLSQIPPAADVYVQWECDAGHRFIATPQEQRSRPGGTRRRSAWCPWCAELARPSRVRTPEPDAGLHGCGHARDPRRIERDPGDDRCYLCRRLARTAMSREELVALATPGSRTALSHESGTAARYSWQCPQGHAAYTATVERILGGRRCPVCRNASGGAALVAVGEAFRSERAPRPASAAEPELRRRLAERLAVDLKCTAVRVATPFHDQLEVWPDIIIAELRVAVEYDTIGRYGLEHVGPREASDRRKDRLLRAVDWEVVRVRCRPLQPLGRHDVEASGVTDAVVERILAKLGEIRGELIVDAYRR